MRRVAEGYTNAKGDRVKDSAGVSAFASWASPCSTRPGRSAIGELRRPRAARLFHETGEPLPRERVTNSPFLGACRGMGIYLLYNGILERQERHGGNVLTRAVLARCRRSTAKSHLLRRLPARARPAAAERIIVRQTPYEIKVS